jgi:aspartate-semialdehyde dehydrogenase
MLKIAIVGATGLVGQTFLQVLEEKEIQADYTLFASSKSKGKIINFMNKDYEVQELTKDINFNSYDYALFSAGSEIAKEYAPLFAKNGAVVIDNSSAFRMDKSVPLIVPEINFEDAQNNLGIIANPNCSTIQAVLPLKAIDEKYKLKRVIYSTYQAVSGAGKRGIDDLLLDNVNKFPYHIKNNVIPHIDTFDESGYTKEELKMINETRKILKHPNLSITATCARIPVLNSHAESINVETEYPFRIEDLKHYLNNFEGIIVTDETKNNIYPLNTIANGTDNVYVGRIRRDYSVENGINFWCVADNIRKGAASNAVQILEKLIQKGPKN